MAGLLGSVWATAVVVLVLAAVLVGVLLRYRALVRAGSGLPPGAGGARLVGVVGAVVAPHDPARGLRGSVKVLGDRWGLADEVDARLAPGDEVLVTEVVGTRLVVVPTPADGQDPATAGPPREPTSSGHRPDDSDRPT